MEESDHGSRVTGGDAEFSTTSDGLQARITVCRHFTKVRNGLEAGSRVTELLKHGVFDALRDDLSVSTAAVEEGWGLGHGVQ
jgi:hypothetical protein